jgi:hypothetical protein
MKMIEPGILFFVNAFVFDRGLHGYRGCDEQKETKGTKVRGVQTSNTERRTSNVEGGFLLVHTHAHARDRIGYSSLSESDSDLTM